MDVLLFILVVALGASLLFPVSGIPDDDIDDD
jgi:hypothetical protein